MNKSKYKRRNFFINKEFQGKLIFNYFLLVVLGSALFVGIISFFSSNTLSIIYENYHLELGITPDILLKKFFSAQWFFIIIGGGAVIIITLFLSHRVAGPFYRFEITLDEMINGDLSQTICLREKDEGKELAGKINLFNNKLSDKVAVIKNYKNNIKEYIEAIEKDLDPALDKDKALLENINEIKKNTDDIESLVSFVDLVKE
ncbi:MAG: methyl-accepting chemotaxis protein [Desulfobacteraceae bacterium]|nr:methyl-accepting chemotaxis protein [Desulfobacteraceae bacterium]